MGVSQLEKVGLADFIVKKKNKPNSKSLVAIDNRSLENWDFTHIKITENVKKHLLACVVQIMVLVMCNTTCYKFGGKLFRQKSGLGIGLRGSAALARLTMCLWDRTWEEVQQKCGLIVSLFVVMSTTYAFI